MRHRARVSVAGPGAARRRAVAGLLAAVRRPTTRAPAPRLPPRSLGPGSRTTLAVCEATVAMEDGLTASGGKAQGCARGIGPAWSSAIGPRCSRASDCARQRAPLRMRTRLRTLGLAVTNLTLAVEDFRTTDSIDAAAQREASRPPLAQGDRHLPDVGGLWTARSCPTDAARPAPSSLVPFDSGAGVSPGLSGARPVGAQPTARLVRPWRMVRASAQNAAPWSACRRCASSWTTTASSTNGGASRSRQLNDSDPASRRSPSASAGRAREMLVGRTPTTGASAATRPRAPPRLLARSQRSSGTGARRVVRARTSSSAPMTRPRPGRGRRTTLRAPSVGWCDHRDAGCR